MEDKDIAFDPDLRRSNVIYRLKRDLLGYRERRHGDGFRVAHGMESGIASVRKNGPNAQVADSA